jgi:hypothetical protein
MTSGRGSGSAKGGGKRAGGGGGGNKGMGSKGARRTPNKAPGTTHNSQGGGRRTNPG